MPPTLTSLVTDSYTVVDLFAQYAFDESMILNLSVDNLFDENYRQYLDQSNSPGLNARVGFTMGFGVSSGAAP